MNAILYRRYGNADVLEMAEIEKPSPKDGEVLIKVRAASLNPLDMHVMHGQPYVMRIAMGNPPKIKPGVDLAGVVEAAGKNVHSLKAGDEVFGSCESGALADYVCTRETYVVHQPPEMTFEEGATVNVAGCTALQGLRKGKIHSGQRVLVHGASGGVGTFAVQIAKAYGAHVTGVCSTRNVQTVKDLGADRVVDYTAEDFAKGADTYDLILDTVGDRSLFAYRRALKPGGMYIALAAPYYTWTGFVARMIAMSLWSPFTTKKMMFGMSRRSREDLVRLREWISSGELRPVIDEQHEFTEEAVRKAMRRLEERRARGKIVVTMP